MNRSSFYLSELSPTCSPIPQLTGWSIAASILDDSFLLPHLPRKTAISKLSGLPGSTLRSCQNTSCSRSRSEKHIQVHHSRSNQFWAIPSQHRQPKFHYHPHHFAFIQSFSYSLWFLQFSWPQGSATRASGDRPIVVGATQLAWSILRRTRYYHAPRTLRDVLSSPFLI